MGVGLLDPTADFGIDRDEVRIDLDSTKYHSCKIIDGNVLMFDFGAGLDHGLVKHRILKLEGDTVVLKDLDTETISTVPRRKKVARMHEQAVCAAAAALRQRTATDLFFPCPQARSSQGPGSGAQ